MKCNQCKSDMQITNNEFTSALDSIDVYSELTIECVNPNCTNKGKKDKIKNKVSKGE